MPRLQARRVRRELQLRPDVRLTVEQYVALVELETGSEAEAQRAGCAYLKSMLEAGESPK